MSAGAVFLGVAGRELLRVRRQPSRIVAAIGTPALIWVFFAGGFASAMGGPDGVAENYALFLLPGMVTLAATFSAIFSAISLINDRREGFLQSALVSPAPAWSIALGKTIGGSAVAFAQAGALVLLAPLLSRDVSATGMLLAFLAAACATLAVTGLGMALAWKVNSVEGFHGVMNLVLMPMWLLSGAVFDPGSAAAWLGGLALVNPLTHITGVMRAALAVPPAPPAPPGSTLSWVVSIAFAGVGLGAAVWSMVRASRPGGVKDTA